MKKIFYSITCIIALISSIIFFDLNIKIRTFANGNNLNLDCLSSYLTGINGEVLYSSNANTKTQIASIVKLMTINLTFEEIEKGNLTLETMLEVSEYASSMGGSQLFLDPNTKHKLDDLLKSVIVASANDSAVVLAETIAGSEKEFVKLMNQKAKDWGMNNTYFNDCTGLSNDHYSTAEDVSIMAQKVLTNEMYTKYSNIWLEEYTHPSGRKTQIANTNKLLKSQSGCIAGKTGTTDSAGYCLVNLTKKDNMNLISVILGAKDSNHRFSLSKDLINYGFANYKNMMLVDFNNPAYTLTLNNSIPEEINLYYKNQYNIIIRKNEELKVRVEYIIDKINLPLKINTTIGIARFFNENNEIICEIDLIVKQDIIKKNIYDNIVNIVENW